MINAGCLTTQTNIPSQVSLLVITMSEDYFYYVNAPKKVITLYKKLSSGNKSLVGIHLYKQKHMPDLNFKYNNLLSHCVNYFTKNTDLSESCKYYDDLKIYTS